MSATAIFSLMNSTAVTTGFGDGKLRFRNAVAKHGSRYLPSLMMMKPCPIASRFSPFIIPTRSFESSVLRRFGTLMKWQECKVRMKVGMPISVAYGLYSDLELIPRYMTFVSSVKVLKDKPDLSRWTLKYRAFGLNLEYSWLGKKLQSLPNQKIHWISLEGLPNRGTVRFFPLGPSSCEVELNFAYEVPLLLIPFASALQPLVQGLIKNGLERSAEISKTLRASTVEVSEGISEQIKD